MSIQPSRVSVSEIRKFRATPQRSHLACAQAGQAWAQSRKESVSSLWLAPPLEVREEPPTAPSLGLRQPRPAVPVTCRCAAQSAPAARGLGIQTAAPGTLGAGRRRGVRAHGAPHRGARAIPGHQAGECACGGLGEASPRPCGPTAGSSVLASPELVGPSSGGGACFCL